MSSSSSSHPHPPVTQKVFGPGVTKGRKTSTAAAATTATKKKSTPNSQLQQRKKPIKFDDMPGLTIESVYWVTPAPGYGNPLNLSSIPENGGKVFVRWLSWESPDQVGYTLYDKKEAKYWADAASIHMLSQAKLAGIDHDYFSFIVYREGKNFKYGFLPREYTPDEKLQSFERFRGEVTQPTIVIKDEAEEKKVKDENTASEKKASEKVNDEEEEEDPIEDIDLINID